MEASDLELPKSLGPTLLATIALASAILSRRAAS
jgi:hypothetical protein